MHPTLQEKRAVLASRTFARSDKLRAFLRFVCEREMAGQTSELTEYLLGTKVLGRPEDFSPLEDYSVRTRACELRGRLQVTPYLETVPENTPRYPAPEELYPLFSRYRYLPQDARLEMQPVQKAVPMGSVESLAKVARVLLALRAQFRILPETSSPLAAMRRRSVVLFASPWYIRSAWELLEKTPWTTRWDEATRQVGILG